MGLEDEVPATRAPALRFLQRIGRGDRAQDIKHGGARGDLQVEIKKAVNQDSDAAEKGGNGQRAADSFGPVVEFGPGMAKREHQEPDVMANPAIPA